MNPDGVFFNLVRFSIQDGPGIRTTVFLKGCPLRCLWCHNPESQSLRRELFFDAKQCIGCRRCAEVCPRNLHRFNPSGIHRFQRKKCRSCFRCAEVCPSNALTVFGRTCHVDEIMTEVEKDRELYSATGGGLTISGGEPSVQNEFTEALAASAKKRGISVAVDTCGYTPFQNFLRLLPNVDLFLFDLKAADCELHKKLTGVENTRILSNLSGLNAAAAEIILRCPLIPGLNDSDHDLVLLADTANRFERIQRIELLPYHPLGSEKYRKTGRRNPLPSICVPDAERKRHWLKIVSEHANAETRIP